jgi:hypothetical protein
MKKSIRLTLALALLCAALSTAMFASDDTSTASLYLIQGIAGRDYSATADPQFPVDILLNDELCNERSFGFATITGPLAFTPGTYDVKISVANTLAPCSNTPLIDTTISLGAGKDVAAVMALDSTGTPELLTFDESFSSVTENNARILFAQAANSPAVQVILENTTTKKLYTYSVNPGALLDVNLPAGNYTVEVNEGTTTLVSSTGLDLYSQSATMLFAIGQASNNTVDLEIKTVRNVL